MLRRFPIEHELSQVSRSKGWQGSDPLNAKIVFIGRDANWDRDISNDREFFNDVCDYIRDGVDYWRTRGFHHPLVSVNPLLPNHQAGSRYHNRFRCLNIDKELADCISFIETIPFPTYDDGEEPKPNDKQVIQLMNKTENIDESINHLKLLYDIMNSTNPKLVFLSNGVLRILKNRDNPNHAFKDFLIRNDPYESLPHFWTIHSNNITFVVKTYHLSVQTLNTCELCAFFNNYKTAISRFLDYH